MLSVRERGKRERERKEIEGERREAQGGRRERMGDRERETDTETQRERDRETETERQTETDRQRDYRKEHMNDSRPIQHHSGRDCRVGMLTSHRKLTACLATLVLNVCVSLCSFVLYGGMLPT